MEPSVELKRYSLYKGLFNIEDVNIIKGKPVQKLGPEGEKYTLEHLLKKGVPEIREVFSMIRDKILSISDAVWERVGAFYCDYRTTSNFVTIVVQKSQLKIYIKMGDSVIEDPKKICKPIPPTYGYGLLNTQFEINKKNEIEYALKLILQAYDYVSG
jgi:predicted transport protein